MFQHKLRTIGGNYATCGFPASCDNRIFASLESNQINYLILDRRNNYEVDEKVNFKKKNQYKKFFDVAYPNVRLKRRIDHLYQFMLDHMQEKEFENKLLSMEEILYERIKV